ncbi:aspartyl/glutamyl-tRNA(Asn/Gln) amidotransferase subunit [Tasmannia lanceolata]|uniref:aspartyl/glutamyl-tRNA(Asn/Gln) amidotransferase subunit n=1 Tax=Tasmannia lanceolata TaxID=3420 RepID=UPI0040638584
MKGPHRSEIRAFLWFIVDTMSCLFGCFRVRDGDRHHAHLISDSVSSKNRDHLVSQNRLASLFRYEEQGSSCEDVGNQQLQSAQSNIDGDSHDSELKDEAKFLKSCGTLLETPAEIRKASEKVKVLPHDGDDLSPKFHSWLPATSCKKLHWGDQLGHIPISHEQQGELPVHPNSGSPEHRLGSFMPEGHDKTKNVFENLETITSELPIETIQCKNRCVRFKCDTVGNSNVDIISSSNCSSESGTHSWRQPNSPRTDDGKRQLVGPKYSPYPTPLKLTDEMQTPGTVYPSKLENFAPGKNARIRSQYVYPVLNPVENLSQWNALKETNASQLGLSGETFEETKQAIPEQPGFSKDQQYVFNSSQEPMGNCRPTVDVRKQNQQSPTPVDASLSHWVKLSSQNDERTHNHVTLSNGKSYSSKSPDTERPILGTVAAHWNDDEPSRISPKWWDGKGIPNSTNKYKEDQKVSWHATPFEERLEKALSDEKLFPPRTLNGKPIDFEESEESDTAASSLQTLTRSETVV